MRKRLGAWTAGLAIGLGAAAPLAGETPAEAQGDTLAIVAGKAIGTREVDELVRAQLMEMRAREYQLRRQALDALVAQALLEKEAAARGVTPEALQKTEIEDKAGVTAADAKAFYESNKGRFGTTAEADALQQIRSGLGQQRQNERRAAFARDLKAKYEVKILLEPYRVPVEVGNAPARGNPKAPVTIVEFSDFQCPFCARARPTVARVREAYGDRVRWVFRHFPLDFHAQAQKAGEAAACAADQGRFWEMHDLLWANGGKLQVADLKAHAATLGLDVAAFDKCLDSGQEAAVVERDAAAGQSFGVSGTPAFFVNGRPLTGAQPFDAFAQVIDDELQRLGTAPPTAAR
ncbi:MAG TPA: thioredoxin domain-containing protein [Vicinamibacteria bacterium]|nr:thioredoxin domain-containing protein [Vicinamibacteria bacterium]